VDGTGGEKPGRLLEQSPKSSGVWAHTIRYELLEQRVRPKLSQTATDVEFGGEGI
jgi:hypothetical protein